MKYCGRRRSLLLGFVFLSLILFSGICASAFAAAQEGEQTETLPNAKAGGGKFRIAYVDYDEYLPASRLFYYILSGLEELGWISPGGLPFTVEEIDRKNLSTEDMFRLLVKADLGPYLEFADGAFWYLGYCDNEEAAAQLTEMAGSQVDFVITFGTSAGVFARELGLPVPTVDFSATDPVASGIIDSATEGSGDPNIWAQVEPSLPLRQLKYYRSVQPFSKLGVIVYADENISGLPDIVAASEESGFELVKYFIEEKHRETQEELDAYYSLVGEKIQEMAEEGIDAFFLTVDLINDTSMLKPLLEPFYQKNIPVYLMDDVEAVRQGGTMLISANDLENVGRFVADAIAKILNGAEAGSLPCIYTSAPSIYLNYEVARRIHYPLTFEFLAACDQIFTEGGQNE